MAAIDEYDVGDAVILTATFTVGSTHTDPDVVTLRLRLPDGTLSESVYDESLPSGIVQQSSAGVYSASFVVGRAGIWWYGWAGAGTLDQSEENCFLVRESKVRS